MARTRSLLIGALVLATLVVASVGWYTLSTRGVFRISAPFSFPWANTTQHEELPAPTNTPRSDLVLASDSFYVRYTPEGNVVLEHEIFRGNTATLGPFSPRASVPIATGVGGKGNVYILLKTTPRCLPGWPGDCLPTSGIYTMEGDLLFETEPGNLIHAFAPSIDERFFYTLRCPYEEDDATGYSCNLHRVGHEDETDELLRESMWTMSNSSATPTMVLDATGQSVLVYTQEGRIPFSRITLWGDGSTSFLDGTLDDERAEAGVPEGIVERLNVSFSPDLSRAAFHHIPRAGAAWQTPATAKGRWIHIVAIDEPITSPLRHTYLSETAVRDRVAASAANPYETPDLYFHETAPIVWAPDNTNFITEARYPAGYETVRIAWRYGITTKTIEYITGWGRDEAPHNDQGEYPVLLRGGYDGTYLAWRAAHADQATILNSTTGVRSFIPLPRAMRLSPETDEYAPPSYGQDIKAYWVPR